MTTLPATTDIGPNEPVVKGLDMTNRPTRGTRWIEQQRSPRYDIWVGNTQVVDPSYYRPACMAIWDDVLSRPMTQLDGQPAGSVLDEITIATDNLVAQPPTLDMSTAARALKWMRHLCAALPSKLVRVKIRNTVSDMELVAGVLAGSITRDHAVRVACERGGTQADARRMLNFAKSRLDHETD